MTNMSDSTHALFRRVRDDLSEYLLPDVFLNPGTFAGLVKYLLPPGKKLKDFEKVLRDYVYSEVESRKISKRVPLSDVFFTMHATLQRRTNASFGPFDLQEVGLGHRHDNRMATFAKKLFEPSKATGEQIGHHLAAFIGPERAKFMSGLRCIYEEDFVRAQDRDFRIRMDLMVNSFLGMMSNDRFNIAFLDEYPWLKDGQLAFYDCCKYRLENGISDCSGLDEFDSDCGHLNLLDTADDQLSVLVYSLKSVISEISLAMEHNRFHVGARATINLHALCKSNESGIGQLLPKLFKNSTQAIVELADVLFESLVGHQSVCGKEYIDESLALIGPLRSFSPIDLNMSEANLVKAEPFWSMMESYCSQLNDLDPEKVGRVINHLAQLNSEASVAFASGDQSRILDMAAKLKDLPDLISQANLLVKELCTRFNLISVALGEMLNIFTCVEAADQGFDSSVSEPSSHQSAIESDDSNKFAELSAQVLALTDVIHNSKSELEKASARYEASQVQLKELRASNHQLKASIDTLQRSSFSNSREGAELSDEGIRDLIRKLSTSESLEPAELLRLYSWLAPDRLVVLPSAIESAEDASDFKNPERIGNTLSALVFEYLDAITSGTADSQARHILGSGYAAKESQTVQQSSTLRSEREFKYQGETVYFRQHIGFGRGYGTQNNVRLYFKVIEGKIVIAYCGAHLNTASTT